MDPRVQHAPGTTAAGSAPHTSQGYNQSSNAGPHTSSMMNKVDPRVDSDLDNRAQHAPGTTAAGNAHPGTTQDSSYSHGSNDGPHRSSMMNKADPRVDARTGDATNTSSHAAGAGHGSFGAGAGAAPTHSHVNTGHEAQYVPHGEQREHGTTTGSSATGSKSANKGEQLGHNVKSMFAGVHVSSSLP